VLAPVRCVHEVTKLERGVGCEAEMVHLWSTTQIIMHFLTEKCSQLPFVQELNAVPQLALETYRNSKAAPVLKHYASKMYRGNGGNLLV
jgi:hypothetical protein